MLEEDEKTVIPKIGFSDQMEVIYFKPFAANDTLKSEPYVSILVPDSTFVYNSELRATSDVRYYESRVTIKELKLKLKQAREMDRPKPSLVIFDPVTFQPFFVSDYEDPRIKNSIYGGIAEVVIRRDMIPPSEFNRFNSPSLSGRCESGLMNEAE